MTLGPYLRKCLRMHTRTGKGAYYTGVFLIRCLRGCLRRVLCWMVMYLVIKWWKICVGDSAYATQSNTASARAHTRLRGLQNIRSHQVNSLRSWLSQGVPSNIRRWSFKKNDAFRGTEACIGMVFNLAQWIHPRFPAPVIGFEDLAYLTWQTLIPNRSKIQHLDVGSELPHNLNCEIISVRSSVSE